MRLLTLAPEIQAYLTKLETRHAIWRFGYRPMGTLAQLPIEEQRVKFASMVADFDAVLQRKEKARVRENWRQRVLGLQSSRSPAMPATATSDAAPISSTRPNV
jgi:hypothetical protein